MRRSLAAAAILIASACGEQETATSAPAPAPAASPAPAAPSPVRESPLARVEVLDAPVTAPPASLALDPFYAKYADAAGIPVVSSAKVADEALLVARTIVLRMLVKRADVKGAIVAAGVRVIVMSRDEKLPDIPELRDVDPETPPGGGNWSDRRGAFSTMAATPVCICAEENVLREDRDDLRGESGLVHEMAHAIDWVALRRLPGSRFERDLTSAYAAAMTAGLWKETYAATDEEEYWAEGTCDWFDASIASPRPNGVSNQVRTRAQLRAYDLALYNLLSDVFPSDDMGLSTGK